MSKMTAFWDIGPCNLAEIGRRFGGAYSLHHQDDEQDRYQPNNQQVLPARLRP
jgi:hypothetical protein